jgi:hypothetical protein
MFKRNIQIGDVKEILSSAETIKEYPNDRPYPSKLLLGFINDIPLHVVVAYNNLEKQMIIVTAYIPDNQIWSNNFKTKIE